MKITLSLCESTKTAQAAANVNDTYETEESMLSRTENSPAQSSTIFSFINGSGGTKLNIGDGLGNKTTTHHN